MNLGIEAATFGVLAVASSVMAGYCTHRYAQWKHKQTITKIKQRSRAALSKEDKRRELVEQEVLRCTSHLHRIAEILQGATPALGAENAPAVASLHMAVSRISANASDISSLQDSARSLHETMKFLQDLSAAYELFLEDSAAHPVKAGAPS